MRSRSHLVSVGEMRALQNALFFTGRSRGVVAESIRSPRGVNSQLPIFVGRKWRSRCGVNSEICWRIMGVPGFDLFLQGGSAESIRGQRGVNSRPAHKMPIFAGPNRRVRWRASSVRVQRSSTHSYVRTRSANRLIGWPMGSRVGRLSHLAKVGTFLGW